MFSFTQWEHKSFIINMRSQFVTTNVSLMNRIFKLLLRTHGRSCREIPLSTVRMISRHPELTGAAENPTFRRR